MSLRDWLDAGEAILHDVLPDEARAALIALGEVETQEGAQKALDLLGSALSSSLRDSKMPEIPVIEEDIVFTESDIVSARTTTEQEMYLFLLQKNSRKHGHAPSGEDCAQCELDALAMVDARLTRGPGGVDNG